MEENTKKDLSEKETRLIIEFLQEVADGGTVDLDSDDMRACLFDQAEVAQYLLKTIGAENENKD